VNSKGSLVAVIVVSIIGLSIVFFGSIRKRPVIIETQAVATEMGDSSTGDYTENGWDYRPQVNTIISDNGRLVIGTDDGLFVMPIHKNRAKATEADLPEKRSPGGELLHLNTIMPLGDVRYTGGDGLYKLDKDYSMALESFFHDKTVYALMEFSDGLLVGTDRGLWFHCDQPLGEPSTNGTLGEIGCSADTLLLPNVMVTALALDRDGLWVGTYGDGLFFYDGQTWRERYLKRDTLAFSCVNALEYSYPNLWVGTDNGIYIYNGGKWNQMFVCDSSESYEVTCFLSTRAATYVGTEHGLLKYANDTLTNVENFAGDAIAGLCVNGKNVIVATRENGIYTYNRKEEIVSPEQLTTQINSGVNEENKVTAETAPQTLSEATNH
jgi:ligand-binding sensor domain-containing protein